MKPSGPGVLLIEHTQRGVVGPAIEIGEYITMIYLLFIFGRSRVFRDASILKLEASVCGEYRLSIKSLDKQFTSVRVCLTFPSESPRAGIVVFL